MRWVYKRVHLHLYNGSFFKSNRKKKLLTMYLSLAAPALALFSLASGQLANYTGFTAQTPTDAMTITSIHNVLALFNLALDSKNFQALRDVYTVDVVARVARTPTNDLDSLIKFYNGTALGDVVTQHTVHTIFVYNIQRDSAQSISYANALYFSKIGQGQFFARDVDTFYERYDDVWQKQQDGRWLIKERSINIYAQVGNSSLVPPTQPTFNTSKV
ncbi:MAG: hypothetical protein Q9218_002859 [Villophora microphyllina]